MTRCPAYLLDGSEKIYCDFEFDHPPLQDSDTYGLDDPDAPTYEHGNPEAGAFWNPEPCRCGEPDCDMDALDRDDLLDRAHKFRSIVRLANRNSERRGEFIRALGVWDEFTRWVQEVYTPKVKVNKR